DVPAGTPSTPWGVPRGLAGLRGLPQREVERKLLLLAGLEARAGAQLLDVAVAELAVVPLRAHAVVDVARGRGVAVAVSHDLLRHLNDRADLLRHARTHVGLEQAEAILLVLPRVDVLLRKRERIDAELRAAVDELVVD